MFNYKFCPKCQKRNHKSHVNCIRCGDQLLDEAKFGKNVFAITLSMIILLTSATVFASQSYFNKKSATTNQPTTQVQDVESTKEVKPATTQDPVKEESVNEPAVQKAPEKKEATTTPQVTPVPSIVATCDVSKKTELTNKYNADVNTATQKRDQLLSEANAEYASAGDKAREGICKDIWDPNQKGVCVSNAIAFAASIFEQKRSSANRDYNDMTTYLTMIYNLDMKSAHCSNQ